ncbi:MAG: hypothetical protein HYS27_23070 [Deltaproteobacteria bacterium]|nr:hypothetical protein [Deltaproteobacteria bacterium]
MDRVYPFGRPVTPRAPSASGKRALFVLGAYPSALYVEWTPPAPWQPVQAIAVDDEPTPFWDGRGQAALVAAWRERVSFNPAWGVAGDTPRFNGSSGAWVHERVLAVLGVAAADTCVSDCLDTYRVSRGAAARIDDTYAPFASTAGLTPAHLDAHPSEDEIVDEALRLHSARLIRELSACAPEIVVTLGNAALRVARELIDGANAAPRRLRPDRSYGTAVDVRISGRATRLIPLAHPAAPAAYQAAQAAWRVAST